MKKEIVKIRNLYILILGLIVSKVFTVDFSLQDVNTTSDTHQEIVGPSYFSNLGKSISINYFDLDEMVG